MTQHIGWVRTRQITEMAVEVERMRNRIAQLSADLEQMDAAIERIGKQRNRGLTRDSLAILRRNREPMLLRDMTVILMTERGMDTADRALVTQMLERLRGLMLRQRAYGVVRREQGEGWAALWSVAI